MPKDDSLVSYSAQFLSENVRAVLIIFYVNFLSSRKYDWNVAPKDLEKIRRMRRIFFKKKMKVYLFQLLLLKRIKSIFQLVFYFIFFLLLLLFSSMFYLWKIFQKYTKSFGGKIWANLHSVSPDNIFETKTFKTCL